GQREGAPEAAAAATPGAGRAGAAAAAGGATAATTAAAAAQAPNAGGRGEGRGAGRGAGRGGPGGPGGPAPAPPQITELKWSEEDFAAAKDGQLPMGKATDEWIFGDVDAVMKTADLVLDETFVTQSTGHQPLETRT